MPPQNPALEYYQSLFPQQDAANKPNAEIDPVIREIRRDRNDEIRRSMLQSGSPDTIGRATRLGREFDIAPGLVEDRLDEAEKGLAVRKFLTLAERYPAIGKFAVANPRGAATAADDYDSLSLLGKVWRSTKETVAGIGPSVASGVYAGGASV